MPDFILTLALYKKNKPWTNFKVKLPLQAENRAFSAFSAANRQKPILLYHVHMVLSMFLCQMKKKKKKINS